MLEVYHKWSEASHLRGFIPHPKTNFSKNLVASRWIIPWSNYLYKNVIYFSKHYRHSFRRSWVEEPRHSEKVSAETSYLHRRTRRSIKQNENRLAHTLFLRRLSSQSLSTPVLYTDTRATMGTGCTSSTGSISPECFWASSLENLHTFSRP